jgi:hypothetical protein
VNAILPDERKSILDVLNQAPQSFLGAWQRKGIQVNGKMIALGRDRIKGGLLAWGQKEVYTFYWNCQEKKWE